MTGQIHLLAAALIALPLAESVAQSGGFEIRAGGFSVDARRSTAFEGTVGTGSGVLTGGELSLRVWHVGVTARLFGGAFAADSGSEAVGRIHSGDVGVLLGPRFFTADVGYARRAFNGALGSRSWEFARVGARSSLPVGATGLTAELRLAFYAGLSLSGQSGGANGRAAETRLTFVPGRLPLYVAVGYRHERFTFQSTASGRPEEVAGILLAGGVRIRL